MELGKLGIWTTYRRIGESQAAEAAEPRRGARLHGVLARRLAAAPERAAAARGDREARRRDEHREHLGLRSGRARGRVRRARARLPGTAARRHRSRPSRGDERLHEAAHGHAGVPRRPRRRRDADSARAPVHRRAGAEDARAERRALARHDPVLRPGRAHARRARAARRRRAASPRRSRSWSTATPSAPGPTRASSRASTSG